MRILPGSDEDGIAVHIQQFEMIRMGPVAMETKHLLLTCNQQQKAEKKI